MTCRLQIQETTTPETKWSNSSNIHNNLAPVNGLPPNDTSEMEILVADSSMDRESWLRQEALESAKRERGQNVFGDSTPVR